MKVHTRDPERPNRPYQWKVYAVSYSSSTFTVPHLSIMKIRILESRRVGQEREA
jgi:hypothetical protein